MRGMNDVEDDFEELLAARARMLRLNPVWLHKSAHVFDEDPPAPARLTGLPPSLGFEK